jgi:RimJ/RimL family protein N-acetyltransferase
MIRLVPLDDSHVPAMLETLRDPEVLRFTRTPQPLPESWLDEWRARFDGVARAAWAVVDGPDDAAQFVGYAVTGPINREDLDVELGYAVSPWARGRGVATETLRQLSQWAFDQGMQRLTALISLDNPSSSRVAEKAGYTLEGVLRSMHHMDGRRGDLQCWSLLPGELRDPAT